LCALTELGGKTGTFSVATLSWDLEIVETLSYAAYATLSIVGVVEDKATAEAVIARLSVSSNNTIVSSGARAVSISV
jgi:hypothetical protein